MEETSISYKLLISGANALSLVNTLKNHNICISNLKKDKNQIEFSITSSDYEEFKKIDLKNYDVKILHTGGKHGIASYFSKRIGIILGIVVSIIIYFMLSSRLIYINISGTDKKNEVISSLKSIGIKSMGYMPSDLNYVENYLSEQLGFTFVSIVSKGNALIINIKENVDTKEEYNPIYADYDMIVTGLEVYAGLPLVGIGDSVCKGDILVDSVTYVDGKETKISPKANITGDCYFASDIHYLNNTSSVVRTGKKKVILSSVSIGERVIFENKYQNSYDTYEIEEYESLVSCYFLPIKIKKVIAYETSDTFITNDFENDKPNIIENLKKEAYSNIFDNEHIKTEGEIVTPVSDGYIVNYYVVVERTKSYK